MTRGEVFHYLKFGFECFILQRRKPIVAGISITDLCNLQCKHCVVANSGRGHSSFEKIISWMKLFYSRGARILYFQGGEPLAWSDSSKKLNDIIREARAIGFFKTAVATNGTNPIETEADIVWVSIDGMGQRHNEIRGKNVFEEVIKNISRSSHPNININMTVNLLNYQDVENVIRLASDNSNIRGVSINFHTPYPGVENLFLPMKERAGVVERVILLKKMGFPVLNSTSGLKALMQGDFKRPIWMIQMVEQDQIFECCWERHSGKACEKCGFGIIAELSQLLQFKPSSIIHAFNLFRSRGIY